MSGNYNIVIGGENSGGFSTARTLTTGSSNILIGAGIDVPAAGTSNYIAIGDAIIGDHQALNIAGNPTTTTQAAADSSTKIATTAFVHSVAVGSSPPTFRYLTTGTGATYITPANCKSIFIEMIGGGGGGGAASINGGSTGGDTIFNGVHAGGGGGGGSAATSAPGTGGTSTTGTALMRWPGATGGRASGGGSGFPSCPEGAVSKFGGNGPAPALSTAGSNAAANSGSGGSGARGGSGQSAAGPGGAGELVHLQINTPAATYSYTVGQGGAGAPAGTLAGGNGGSGLIIVTEYY